MPDLDRKPMIGVTISKGVMHRPRAEEKTGMLMVETSSIDPIGDCLTADLSHRIITYKLGDHKYFHKNLHISVNLNQ